VEELVPSPAVALTLREDLPTDEVTIGRDLWRRLVVVGGGTTAGAFGTALDLDEYATGYAIRDLVDAGLVEVGDEVVEPVADLTPEAAPIVIVAPVAEIAPEPETVPEPEPAVAPEAAPVLAAETAPEPPLAPAAEADPEIPPLLGVVPDPPYSFGRWGEGPVPAPEVQADPAALGPWEPLSPPVPAEDEAEVLPSLDTVEPLAAFAAPAPPEALPSLDAPAPADPVDAGSYAVDLDNQLGGAATGHSYLSSADGGGGLPEPLLGVDVPPPAEAPAAEAPAPEASLPEAPVAEADAGDHEDELAARRDRADEDARAAQRARSEELGVPLDSLSPAAARALAAAASADDDGDDDTDAGRRVLRRIISTGKG